MSEEEIIKEIESLSPSEEAIQGILDLYNKEKEKNKRNKRIILDKLDKLKNGIENDFPITLGKRQPLWEENKTDYISKDKIRELPRTEYCNAECLMNGIYVDWDYIKELLEEE